MENESFAQTCGNYDNISYRHPTFNQPYRKPPPYRHPTPFTKRRKNTNQVQDGVQGIKYGVTETVVTNTKVYSHTVIEDVFDLLDKPLTDNDNDNGKFDFMDTDSDLSTDSNGSKFSNEDKVDDNIKVDDNVKVEDNVKVDEEEDKSYITYCRNCYTKLKNKIINRKSIKNTTV